MNTKIYCKSPSRQLSPQCSTTAGNHFSPEPRRLYQLHKSSWWQHYTALSVEFNTCVQRVQHQCWTSKLRPKGRQSQDHTNHRPWRKDEQKSKMTHHPYLSREFITVKGMSFRHAVLVVVALGPDMYGCWSPFCGYLWNKSWGITPGLTWKVLLSPGRMPRVWHKARIILLCLEDEWVCHPSFLGGITKMGLRTSSRLLCFWHASLIIVTPCVQVVSSCVL